MQTSVDKVETSEVVVAAKTIKSSYRICTVAMYIIHMFIYGTAQVQLDI